MYTFSVFKAESQLTLIYLIFLELHVILIIEMVSCTFLFGVFSQRNKHYNVFSL